MTTKKSSFLHVWLPQKASWFDQLQALEAGLVQMRGNSRKGQRAVEILLHKQAQDSGKS